MWVRSGTILLSLVWLLLLQGCSGDSGSGPKEVKWDRDACERCRMVLSDHTHAAQIRYTPPDKQRSVVALFDDIGCATLWLDDKPWRDDAKTEIWVTDHRTGQWIDARKAFYVSGHLTPMEYGLGAQLEPAPEAMTYEQAKQQIISVEKRFNAHGAHLLERLEEQAKRREAQTSPETQPLPSIKQSNE